jgi:polar amino acid transport system substrate-binding protein
MTDQQVRFRTARGMAPSVRLSAVLAGALVLALSIAGCGSNSKSNDSSNNSGSSSTNAAQKLLPASIKSKGAITYSSPFDYPPWDFQSSSGGYDGMEYELITAVGKILGLKINTVKASSFSGLIPAVQSGRIDVGAEAINILPDRLKVVSFAGWTNYTDGLIVKAGNPDDINTGDVCGLKIAVVTASSEIALYDGISKTCEAAGKPGVSVSQFAQTSAVLLAVEGGRAQAGGFDIFNNAYIAQTSDGKLETAPGDAIGTPIPVGMAVAKTADGEALGKAISAALAQMQASGDLGKIFDKWKIPQSAINVGFQSQ